MSKLVPSKFSRPALRFTLKLCPLTPRTDARILPHATVAPSIECRTRLLTQDHEVSSSVALRMASVRAKACAFPRTWWTRINFAPLSAAAHDVPMVPQSLLDGTSSPVTWVVRDGKTRPGHGAMKWNGVLLHCCNMQRTM